MHVQTAAPLHTFPATTTTPVDSSSIEYLEYLLAARSAQNDIRYRQIAVADRIEAYERIFEEFSKALSALEENSNMVAKASCLKGTKFVEFINFGQRYTICESLNAPIREETESIQITINETNFPILGIVSQRVKEAISDCRSPQYINDEVVLSTQVKYKNNIAKIVTESILKLDTLRYKAIKHIISKKVETSKIFVPATSIQHSMQKVLLYLTTKAITSTCMVIKMSMYPSVAILAMLVKINHIYFETQVVEVGDVYFEHNVDEYDFQEVHDEHAQSKKQECLQVHDTILHIYKKVTRQPLIS